MYRNQLSAKIAAEDVASKISSLVFVYYNYLWCASFIAAGTELQYLIAVF